jgi:redox-sensitive bicupin YhaK (pirin superfamily)
MPTTIEVRPLDSLSRFEIDWLKARHHFSLGGYHDPERMGVSVLHMLGAGRQAYLVAARGRIQINGEEAQPRDGVVVRGEGTVTIEALDDAEILLADLP